jgi:uncharacterized protein YggL (DUF469 family)
VFHTPNIIAAPSTLDKLDTLIAKLIAARGAAMTGDLFASHQGVAVIHAMHDLTEVDALYDLAENTLAAIGSQPLIDWHYELESFRAAPVSGRGL